MDFTIIKTCLLPGIGNQAVMGTYWLLDTWDRRTLGPYVAELYSLMVSRLMKYRDQNPDKSRQFLDIKYSSLVADPIAQVRNIYQFYGLKYDEALTDKMKDYLSRERQHKHGKPDYGIEKYGLVASEIDNRFAEYSERYL